jgi:hypothetical protein
MMGVVIIVLGLILFSCGVGLLVGTKVDFTIGVDEGVSRTSLTLVKSLLKDRTNYMAEMNDKELYSSELRTPLLNVIFCRSDELLLKMYPSG